MINNRLPFKVEESQLTQVSERRPGKRGKCGVNHDG